eukprot:TRINITY_DN1232_c0_g1_i1.p3 TRINITY_DN1232_c0_g1~~TRINITY_DN1232_c0_g1_i1.p3  ORF type:complete len:101 (+),score=25.12 TRINITY_DN1232_c0_g1_i1:1537-1839(+)
MRRRLELILADIKDIIKANSIRHQVTTESNIASLFSGHGPAISVNADGTMEARRGTQDIGRKLSTAVPDSEGKFIQHGDTAPHMWQQAAAAALANPEKAQ